MKRLLLIATFILLLPTLSFGAYEPSGSGSGVETAADCTVAAYQAIGKLCQDTGTGKLYKGTGSGVEEIPAPNASTTGSAGSLKSNATTGIMQVVGPAAGATRVVTIPDANATVNYKSGAYTDGHILGADGTAGAVKDLGAPISMTSDTTGPKYYDTTADTWETGSYALTPVIDDPDNFAANFTGANLYGGTFIANAAGTAALPDATVGMNFTVVLEGANAVVLEPLATGTDDTIYLNGTALTQGHNITSSTAGAMCVFQYRNANTWMATCTGFVDGT